VVRQLVEIDRARAATRARRDDDLFYAEQNARLVKNAEAYYRTMFRGRVASWNLRDRHMLETLEALDAHLARGGRPPRFAVWAHNSHLGDARATEMGEAGEWNVGQLVRETWPVRRR
jgi:erythromycin esterase-like protein